MDSTAAIWQSLTGGSPVLVVLFDAYDSRAQLVSLVESLTPLEQPSRRVSDIASVFQDPSTLLLVTPEDEAAAIEEIEGRRDTLLGRTAPAILFLMRDGAGMRALREAPALSSWLQGHVYDPDERNRESSERARAEFVEITGVGPETWLADWRRGVLPDTLENNLRAGRALAILHRGSSP